MRAGLGALALAMPLGIAAAYAVLSDGKSLRDIPAGTGYAALELCTRTLHSGERFEHVRTRYLEPKVAPLPDYWRIERGGVAPGPDADGGHAVTVRTWLPLLEHARTAVYRPGLGCTLVPPGVAPAAVRAERLRLSTAPPPSSAPWPGGEGAPERAHLDAATAALIERHAELLFAEPDDDAKRRQNTTALLVARDGRLLYERYGLGYTRAQPQLGWSMTKTLTALIAGTLAQDGLLALDAEVGLPRWRGTPKQAITWRALLNMAPGLEWFEGYGGASDATEMLFSQADQGAWAADRPLTSPPGRVFTYSTGFSNIAMLRMRQLLGGSQQALYDHYQRRVLQPLAIRGGVIEPDASGTPVGGARGMLRPVDWLRLGQLVADGGLAGDARVVPAAWIDFMTAASPASDHYGGSLWRQPSDTLSPGLRARLPRDLVFFAGHMGQFTIVSPSRRLVVVRMGVELGSDMHHSPARDRTFTLVADLLDR